MMTTRAEHIGVWTTLRARCRWLFPTPLGWHTRYAVRAYFWDTLLVLSGVLAVALTIDLSRYLSGVLSANPSQGIIAQGLLLAWYIAMRCIDRTAEYLQFACFFGVLWAEIRQTTSGDRLALIITGRSPLQCLAPLIIFSILMGTFELALLIYLRPAAVMAQAAAHLGEYGQLFDRRPTTEPKWIAAGDSLVQARIDFSAPPVLRDIRMFRFDSGSKLREILQASYATPVEGERSWLFHDGQRWTIKDGGSSDTNFIAEKVTLDIQPFWLRYFGIDAKYLPNDVFRALGNLVFHPAYEYRTWVQGRFAIPLVVAGMAFLAGSLFILLLSNGIRVSTLLLIVLIGYASHVLSSAALILGEHGWISPLLAAWPMPILILAFPFIVYQWRKTRGLDARLVRQNSHLRHSEKPLPR